MTTRRDAILRGVERASELHYELGLREALKGGDRPLDVLGAVQTLGLFVLFRPLEGLLGAYMPTAAGPGMLVTTRRNLHIQRFTAAHELGHHVLGHRVISLDTDVGFVGRGDLGANHNLQEIEADAFASEFLLPKWLLAAQARRHRWGRQELIRPDVVYQLSLRLGVSYAATCWALAENKIIDPGEAKALIDTPPKVSKQLAMPDVEPESWHSDVWVLSEHDQRVQVLGNPDDRLILALKEHVASGYTWDTEGVTSAGLSVDRDDRATVAGNAIGAPITRRLVIRGAAQGKLQLRERRAWDPSDAALNTYELDLALVGAEAEGLPRAVRSMAA